MNEAVTGYCPNPKCLRAVKVQADGSLAPHERYADGSGSLAHLPHELQQCEGATADVTDDQIRAYLDRNADAFREFLHREVRRDPNWFHTYLYKETRIAGRFPFQRPG